MSVRNLEISSESLLSAVVSLPKLKFEQFVSDARRLKKREEMLIAKISKFDLTEDEKKNYQKLSRKFRAENISKEEYKQLTRLIDKLESLNVERLECLSEIAKICKKTLAQVMKELKIKPKNYE